MIFYNLGLSFDSINKVLDHTKAIYSNYVVNQSGQGSVSSCLSVMLPFKSESVHLIFIANFVETEGLKEKYNKRNKVVM